MLTSSFLFGRTRGAQATLLLAFGIAAVIGVVAGPRAVFAGGAVGGLNNLPVTIDQSDAAFEAACGAMTSPYAGTGFASLLSNGWTWLADQNTARTTGCYSFCASTVPQTYSYYTRAGGFKEITAACSTLNAHPDLFWNVTSKNGDQCTADVVGDTYVSDTVNSYLTGGPTGSCTLAKGSSGGKFGAIGGGIPAGSIALWVQTAAYKYSCMTISPVAPTGTQSLTGSDACAANGVVWPQQSLATVGTNKRLGYLDLGYNSCDGGQCGMDIGGQTYAAFANALLYNGPAGGVQLQNDPKSGTTNYLCQNAGYTNPEGFTRGPRLTGDTSGVRTCYYVGLGNTQSGKQASPGWSCDPHCDSCGGKITTALCSAPLPPAIEASCAPSPAAAATGQAVTWTATVTKGQTPLTYKWQGDESLTGTAASVSKTYATAGAKKAYITVTDKTNATKTFECSSAASITAPLAASCSVSPASALTGASVTWTATASGGTGAYTYSWTGSDGLTGTAATVSKAYTAAGSKTASVTVKDAANATQTVACANAASITTPAPAATLSANPTQVLSGAPSVLTWSSANVTSCTGSGFSTGGATSGSRTMNPTATTNYAVTCTGPNGSASMPATVTVLEPTAAITASPDRVHPGDSTTLTWNAENVTSCTITGPGVNITQAAVNKVVTGSRTVPIETQSAFVITCDPSGSGTTHSAIVNLLPGFAEF